MTMINIANTQCVKQTINVSYINLFLNGIPID